MSPEVRIRVGLGQKLNELLINFDDVVAFYRFDEFEIDTAVDSFRQRNNGTYSGSGFSRGVLIPEYPEVIFGLGSDGHVLVTVPNDGDGYLLAEDPAARRLSLASGPIGIYVICSFDHNSATERVLAQKYDSGTGNGWRIIQVNGGLTFRGYNATSLLWQVSTGDISDDTTQRVYFTFEPGTAICYVNGIAVDTDSIGGTELIQTSVNMFVFANNQAAADAGTGFIGVLSSLLITRRADSGIAPAAEAAIGWTDVSDSFIIVNGMNIRRGIQNKSITARMATASTCQFDLLNVDNRYSPQHEDKLTGWGNTVPIQVDVWDDSDSSWKTQFRGRISDIDPDSDPHGPQTCAVTAASWLFYAASFPIGTLPILTNAGAGQAFGTALDFARLPPPGVDIPVGDNVFQFVFDRINKNTTVSNVLNTVVMSELSYAYERRDGTVVMEFATERMVTDTPDYVLDKTMNDVKAPTSVSSIINIIQTDFAPRSIVEDQTVYVMPRRIKISPNDQAKITVRYRDPEEKAQQTAAIDIETLLPNVHYSMTVNEDGGGGDLTVYAQVIYTPESIGGVEATFTVMNTSGLPGFFSIDALIGTALLTYEVIEILEESQASIDANGPYEYRLQQPYVSDYEVIKQNAQRIKLLSETQIASVGSLVIRGDQHLEMMLNADVGSSVALGNEKLGLLTSRTRYINAVNMSINDGYIEVEYVLTVGPQIFNPYWLLGIAGRSELGETTYLG